MAKRIIGGKNWTVESDDKIVLFDLVGYNRLGRTWTITVNFLGAEMLAEVSPAPALEEVLKVVRADEAAGNLGKIFRVVVSSRIAVRLFLEGVLSRTDFESGVTEGEVDVSKVFNDNGPALPVILLERVKLGDYEFQFGILSEKDVDSGFVVTVDLEGNVV